MFILLEKTYIFTDRYIQNGSFFLYVVQFQATVTSSCMQDELYREGGGDGDSQSE